MAAARRTGLVLAALCLAQLAVIAQVSKLPAWPLSRSLGMPCAPVGVVLLQVTHACAHPALL